MILINKKQEKNNLMKTEEFGQRLWSRKYCGEKNLVKKSLIKNLWVQQKFWAQKFFGQKFFWPKTIVVKKKKIFSNILGPENFHQKNYGKQKFG